MTFNKLTSYNQINANLNLSIMRKLLLGGLRLFSWFFRLNCNGQWCFILKIIIFIGCRLKYTRTWFANLTRFYPCSLIHFILLSAYSWKSWSLYHIIVKSCEQSENQHFAWRLVCLRKYSTITCNHRWELPQKHQVLQDREYWRKVSLWSELELL